MSLKDDPRIVEFETQVRMKVIEVADYVLDGKCTSFDEYKKRTGHIKGLRESVNIMLEVLKNYGKEDQDEI